jgi:hypothetical protein
MQTDLPPVVPPPYSAGEPKNNAMAMVSLGLGIGGFLFLCVSVVFAICACVSGLMGIAALVTGYMARQQMQTSGEQGNGMAITGMILGGLQIIIVTCGVIFTLLIVIVPSIGEIFKGLLSGLK